MKTARLLHNPKAGDEEHSKKKLLKAIEAGGYTCSYASVKEKGWDDFDTEVDFLVVAGGDGTVRRVAGSLLHRKVIEKKWPLALLPLGTANNIGKTIQATGDVEDVVASWEDSTFRKFDAGRVDGFGEERFFLESFGMGIFPRLMQEMKDADKELSDVPEERLKIAVEKLHKIIETYEARACTIEVDDISISGNFLLIEVMNICSIGPNLHLAPHADPGDGIFEVVLISQSQREHFANDVLRGKIDADSGSTYTTLRGASIRMHCECNDYHADDERLELDEQKPIEITMLGGALEFLQPAMPVS